MLILVGHVGLCKTFIYSDNDNSFILVCSCFAYFFSTSKKRKKLKETDKKLDFFSPQFENIELKKYFFSKAMLLNPLDLGNSA